MKTLRVLLVLLAFCLSVHVMAGDPGKYHVLNQQLQEAAQIGLNNFQQLFPEPGPVRVRIKSMLEALAQSGRNGRALNPGIAPYQNGYILSVRVLFHAGSGGIFSEVKPVIPGNRPVSKFEQGRNFWWQDFASDQFSGGTLYFYADQDLNNVSLLVPVNYSSYSDRTLWQDLRLVSQDGEIIVFDPKRSSIASKLEIETGNRIYFQGNWRNAALGNNYSAIDIADDSYSYLDWYFTEGVRFTYVKDGSVSHKYLKYADPNYPILGTGSDIKDGDNAGANSGIMPLFSFGSSHIKLDEDTYLGVGHIKIQVDQDEFKYKEGSNIDRFRQNLTSDFKANYGGRYIRHDAFNSVQNKSQGYHYLMYFYWFKLDANKNPVAMQISDAFLPIDIKAASKKDEYVFSLVFPMGVAQKYDDKNTLLISTGIGDYYAAVLELPLDKVKELCKHDVQKLNLSEYQYKIMRFDGEGQFDILDRLAL